MPELSAAEMDSVRQAGKGQGTEAYNVRDYRNAVNRLRRDKVDVTKRINDIETIIAFNESIYPTTEMNPYDFYAGLLNGVANDGSVSADMLAKLMSNNPTLVYRCNSSRLNMLDEKQVNALLDLMGMYNNGNYESCHNWNDIYGSDASVLGKSIEAKGEVLNNSALSDEEKLQRCRDIDRKEASRQDKFLDKNVKNTFSPNNEQQKMIVQTLMDRYDFSQREAELVYLESDVLMARIQADNLKLREEYIVGYETVERTVTEGDTVKTVKLEDRDKPIYDENMPESLMNDGFDVNGLLAASAVASNLKKIGDLENMTEAQCQEEYGCSKKDAEAFGKAFEGAAFFSSKAFVDDVNMKSELKGAYENEKTTDAALKYLHEQGRRANPTAVNQILRDSRIADAISDGQSLDSIKGLDASRGITMSDMYDKMLARYHDFPNVSQPPPTKVDAAEMWANMQFPYLRRYKEEMKRRDQEFGEKWPNSPRGIDTSDIKKFFHSIFAEVARGLYRDGYLDDLQPSKSRYGMMGLTGKYLMSNLGWGLGTSGLDRGTTESAQRVAINGKLEKQGIDWDDIKDYSAYGHSEVHDIDGHPSANQYAVMTKDIGRGRSSDAASDYNRKLEAAQSEADRKGMGQGPDNDGKDIDKGDEPNIDM